jgi:hypothetical protein
MESLGDRDSKKTEEALEAKTSGPGRYLEKTAGLMERFNCWAAPLWCGVDFGGHNWNFSAKRILWTQTWWVTLRSFGTFWRQLKPNWKTMQLYRHHRVCMKWWRTCGELVGIIQSRTPLGPKPFQSESAQVLEMTLRRHFSRPASTVQFKACRWRNTAASN